MVKYDPNLTVPPDIADAARKVRAYLQEHEGMTIYGLSDMSKYISLHVKALTDICDLSERLLLVEAQRDAYKQHLSHLGVQFNKPDNEK